MGESVDDPVKCLLVDPPTDGDGTTAQRFRLLSAHEISPRLDFVYQSSLPICVRTGKHDSQASARPIPFGTEFR